MAAWLGENGTTVGTLFEAPLMRGIDVNADHGEHGFQFFDDDPDDPRDNDWLT